METPHKKIYQFPVNHIPAGLSRITLTVTINSVGDNASLNATDYGLNIVEIGNYCIESDENIFLAPVTMDFTIYDQDSVLYNYLFQNLDTDKGIRLHFEIKKGDVYATEFEGCLVYDDFEYDEHKKLLKATFTPKVRDLNDCVLWDDQTTPQPTNPLGYSLDSLVNVITLITDIFKYIDPETTVSIYQDWQFQSLQWDDPPYNLNYLSGNFADIYICINSYFYERGQFVTLADVLRNIAWEFGCYAGWESSKKAFFRLLKKGSNSTVTTPQMVAQYDYITKTRKYQPLKKYAKVAVKSPRNIPNYGSFDFYYNVDTNTYLNGLGSHADWVSENYSPCPTELIYSGYTTQFHSVVTAYGQATIAVGTWFLWNGVDNFWPIDEAAPYPQADSGGNPIFNGKMYAQLLANYYYEVRCILSSSMYFTLQVFGTNYTLQNDIEVDGKRYYIIALEKDYNKETTKLECISIPE
jgi:hypothetical protein